MVATSVGVAYQGINSVFAAVDLTHLAVLNPRETSNQVRHVDQQ